MSWHWVAAIGLALAIAGCERSATVPEELLECTVPPKGRTLEGPFVTRLGSGLLATWTVEPIAPTEPSWGWMVDRTREYEITDVSERRFRMVRYERGDSYHVEMEQDPRTSRIHVRLTVLPR